MRGVCELSGSGRPECMKSALSGGELCGVIDFSAQSLVTDSECIEGWISAWRVGLCCALWRALSGERRCGLSGHALSGSQDCCHTECSMLGSGCGAGFWLRQGCCQPLHEQAS